MGIQTRENRLVQGRDVGSSKVHIHPFLLPALLWEGAEDGDEHAQYLEGLSNELVPIVIGACSDKRDDFGEEGVEGPRGVRFEDGVEEGEGVKFESLGFVGEAALNVINDGPQEVLKASVEDGGEGAEHC
eukprot:evm.model.NODE_23878_length_30850_cov_23.449724.9